MKELFANWKLDRWKNCFLRRS